MVCNGNNVFNWQFEAEIPVSGSGMEGLAVAVPHRNQLLALHANPLPVPLQSNNKNLYAAAAAGTRGGFFLPSLPLNLKPKRQPAFPFRTRSRTTATANPSSTHSEASQDNPPNSVSGDSIRRRFLDFYASRGHKVLPSASLVPDDPTVLLTIAGMLQFKPIFLGKVYMLVNVYAIFSPIFIHSLILFLSNLRFHDKCLVQQLPKGAYVLMMSKMLAKLPDIIPFLRCLETSALVITSKKKQFDGHGSFQPLSEQTIICYAHIFIFLTKIFIMFFIYF